MGHELALTLQIIIELEFNYIKMLIPALVIQCIEFDLFKLLEILDRLILILLEHLLDIMQMVLLMDISLPLLERNLQKHMVHLALLLEKLDMKVVLMEQLLLVLLMLIIQFQNQLIPFHIMQIMVQMLQVVKLKHMRQI